MFKTMLRKYNSYLGAPLHKREEDGAKHTSWHNYTIYNVDQYLIDDQFRGPTTMSSRSFSSGANIEADKWYFEVMFTHTRGRTHWINVAFASVIKSVSRRGICSLYAIDKNGKSIHINSVSTTFLAGYCDLGDILEKNSVDEQQLYVVNNSLTLRIKLTIFLDDKTLLPGFPAICLCSKANLPNHFQTLYENRKKSACKVIKIKGKEFPIHEEVLQLRCPKLLNSIASGDSLDDEDDDNNYVNDNNYDIPLIHDEILKGFEKLIEFIYTDEITDYDDCIVALYILSCTYRLNVLQKICEKIICDFFLTGENFAVFFELAEQLNSFDFIVYLLKFKTLNRIKHHEIDAQLHMVAMFLSSLSIESTETLSIDFNLYNWSWTNFESVSKHKIKVSPTENTLYQDQVIQLHRYANNSDLIRNGQFRIEIQVSREIPKDLE